MSVEKSSFMLRNFRLNVKFVVYLGNMSFLCEAKLSQIFCLWRKSLAFSWEDAKTLFYVRTLIVSNISLICAGNSSTFVSSKNAISCLISALMYRIRRSVVMFSAKCCQNAKNIYAHTKSEVAMRIT